MRVILFLGTTMRSSLRRIVITTRLLVTALLTGKVAGGTRAVLVSILMVCTWGKGKHTTVETTGAVGKWILSRRWR
jgi:hypothetical protein